MALNGKKNNFGLNLEDSFKKVGKPDTYTDTDTHAHTDTDVDAYTDKREHTDTDTSKYTHQHTDTYKKETKSKRLYLLAKPTVHKKLDEYAKAHDDTFNNLVHTLMEEFIERNKL